jgi:hypothetical protein
MNLSGVCVKKITLQIEIENYINQVFQFANCHNRCVKKKIVLTEIF